MILLRSENKSHQSWNFKSIKIDKMKSITKSNSPRTSRNDSKSLKSRVCCRRKGNRKRKQACSKDGVDSPVIVNLKLQRNKGILSQRNWQHGLKQCHGPIQFSLKPSAKEKNQWTLKKAATYSNLAPIRSIWNSSAWMKAYPRERYQSIVLFIHTWSPAKHTAS